MVRRQRTQVCGAFFLLWLVLAAGAQAQWELKADDGKTSIKFGYLVQLRAESEELANGEDAQNLFFRRLRLMFGGKLSEKWSYFIETDSPNLGKSDNTGAKDAGDVFIQDAYFTYEHSDQFKVDLGMILIPFARNSSQSAATHLAQDYGPYSFLSSAPTRSRVGRDYGIQARGYLAAKKFEYRFGVFDGARGASAAEEFRYAGRVAYNFFETETGFFYTGNNLGAKRQLAIGAAFDVQDDYTGTGFDIFYDQPIGKGGDAFTLQFDLINYDGGTTFTALPDQDTTLLEVGYWFASKKLQPFLQLAERDFANGATPDEDQLWVGLNYRPAKHNATFRAAYGQLGRDGADDRNVIQLTFQLFKF
jgi:hypothetical protein